MLFIVLVDIISVVDVDVDVMLNVLRHWHQLPSVRQKQKPHPSLSIFCQSGCCCLFGNYKLSVDEILGSQGRSI